MLNLLRLHDDAMTLEQELDLVWRPIFSGKVQVFGDTPSSLAPRVMVVEDPYQFRVTAEFPDAEVKNIRVNLTSEGLHISQVLGSFKRLVPLPTNADPSKAAATFKGGILIITVPKITEN